MCVCFGGVEKRGWMVNVVNAGFYFLSRLFFPAITSIMVIQRAKQASLHGLHRLVLIRYEINYSRHVLKTFKFWIIFPLTHFKVWINGLLPK